MKEATKKGQRSKKEKNAEQEERDQMKAWGRQKQKEIGGERSKREENKRVEIAICPQKLLEKNAAQKRKGDMIYAREDHFTLLPPPGSITQGYTEGDREKWKKREKKRLLFCFTYYPFRKWPCSCSLLTRSTPLNGTIWRANRFSQVGAFMNKTWPPSHERHKPLQFHTGHGQDKDCLYALAGFRGFSDPGHWTHK